MRLSPEITCQNLLACLFRWTIWLATFFSPSLLFNILKDKLSLEEAPQTPLCWHRSTRPTRDSYVPGKKKKGWSVFKHSPPHPPFLQLSSSGVPSWDPGRTSLPAGKEPSSASPGSRHGARRAELRPCQHNLAGRARGVCKVQLAWFRDI